MSDAQFTIGIDPGVNTGFAVYSRTERRLVVCETSTFRKVIQLLSDSREYSPATAEIIVEDCTLNRPRFRFKRGEGVRDRMSQNVGEVKAATKLMIEWLESLGYRVKRERPETAKWDQTFFERVTRWTGRTSQHARDAAKLCYGVSAIGAT